MKSWLMSIAILAFVTSAYSQDSQSLGEVARQNQEQKKARRTLTNDDLSGSSSGTTSGAELAVAPGSLPKSDDAENKPSTEPSHMADDSSADQPKPDRSNVVGDIPGFTPEPKDRIETLKIHASQWDAMIANFEKKIAAEKDPEKRDSLETMLEHARQNQAKDAAEQKSLEKSEAEKANAQSGDQPAPEQQPPQSQ